MALGPAIKFVLTTWPISFALWTVATVVGVSSGSVPAAIILRTLFVCFSLAVVTSWIARRSAAFDKRMLLISAVVVYAIFPPTWEGRTLVGQIVLDPGVLTIVVDLVLWSALAFAVHRRTPRPQTQEHVPYQSQK